MRLTLLTSLFFITASFAGVNGQAFAGSPLNSIFLPTNKVTSKPTTKLKMKWKKFFQKKRNRHFKLRTNLAKFCRLKKVRPRALADMKGKLSLAARESRIIALDFRTERIQRYITLLKKTYKKNKYEQKITRISYIVSDALFTLSSYGLSRTLKVPWLQVVMPVGLKLTNQLVSGSTTIPQPSPFQLQLNDDMARLLQVIQFRLNPGPFQKNACYLSALKLRDPLGKRCHPDHPFIRSRHKQLGQLWKKSRTLLRRNDLPAFWSAVFEFLTHRRQKVLKNQEFFILATSSLLSMQAQYLKKMRMVLHNDYQAWGCEQLHRIKTNKKKGKRISL